MAQNKKHVATFKTAETAALYGQTTKDKGTVTFHSPDIVTVEFKSVVAMRVNAALFNIVAPKQEATDESED